MPSHTRIRPARRILLIAGSIATLVAAIIAIILYANPMGPQAEKYEMGSWIRLDSDAMANPSSGSQLADDVTSGTEVLAFRGSLDMRIDSVKRYESPREAGIADNDERLIAPELYYKEPYMSEHFGFMLIEATVKNIDATPTATTYFGHKRFLASSLVPLSPSIDLAYFSGVSTTDARRKERGYFDLAPGETRTLSLGYAIDDASKEAADDAFSLAYGPRLISLTVQDNRREAA